MSARCPVRCVALLLLAGPALAASAGATGLSYSAQTGTVYAEGQTATLGAASDEAPIAGLADVDDTRFVEDGDSGVPSGTPPGYYRARAEVQTSLGSSAFAFSADTEADAIWDGVGCCEDEFTRAASGVDLSVGFELDQAGLVLLSRSATPGRFNGPLVQLTSLDLGFVFSADDDGEGALSCGSLDFAECEALLEIFYRGATLPAGEYRLGVSVFAFDPLGGSCAVGCGSAGGTVLFEVIPEPASAGLLALGLAGLARWRRRPGV